MTNILFVVRVLPRDEPDPGYAIRRGRSQVGEVEDWLPEGVWPGNAIVDDPQYRLIEVTGVDMTPTLANNLKATDLLSAQDQLKGFEPRFRVWRFDYNKLPGLEALQKKIPFAERGTVYDATYTVDEINPVLDLKPEEARDINGRPIEAAEIPIDRIDVKKPDKKPDDVAIGAVN